MLSISVDGATGMRDVVLHLIKVHNHRRIAFIRGPTTSLEAEERCDLVELRHELRKMCNWAAHHVHRGSVAERVVGE